MPNALDLLREAGQTLSTCESLTAGSLGALIASHPGASDVYAGGFITYSAELKTLLAGVPQELIDAHGTISAECAEAMASGTRDRLGTDWAISLTGVAGPDTAEDNPVGVVWMGIAGPRGSFSLRVLPHEQTRWALRSGASQPEEVLDGDRELICQRSAEFAFAHLASVIVGN